MENISNKQGDKFKKMKEGFENSSPSENLERPLTGRSDIPFVDPEPITFDIPSTTKPKLDSNLEKMATDFNKLLAQYASAYKNMSDEIIHNNSLTPITYANQNIEYNNQYYYVNEFGFASNYDVNAWENRPESCSSGPVSITAPDFNGLLGGPNRVAKQPCGVSGHNITGGGQNAWVDIKGVKHIYPKDVWENRSEACNMTPLPLEKDEFDAIIAGDAMTNTSFCERLNVTPSTLQTMSNLNKKLLDLGNNLLSETQNLATKDNDLAQKLQFTQNQIINKVKQLKKIEGDPGMMDTTSGKIKIHSGTIDHDIEAATRSSKLFLKMNHFKYTVGLILVIILLIFSFSTFSSNNPSPLSILIILIIALIGLYNLFNYIKKSFFKN